MTLAPTRLASGNGRQISDTLPPHDVEAEQSVLGGMMLAPDHIADVARMLRPADFFRAAHMTLYDVLVAMHRDGIGIDAVTVRARLRDAGKLDAIGRGELTSEYLATLLETVPSAAHVHHYAQIVRDKARQRHMADRLADVARNVRDGTTTPDDAASYVRELADGHADRTRPLVDSMSSADLVDSPLTLSWLVRGVLVAGQPGIIGGPRKSLKTSLLIDLGISLASARQFLGTFFVPQARRVLLMSGESGQATIRETALRVARGKVTDAGAHIDLRDLPIRWAFALPRLSDAQHLAALRDHIQEHRAEVVILDPAYLCLLAGNTDADERSIFAMGSVLAHVSDIIGETGATVILAHHYTRARKHGDKHDPADLDELAYAGFAEFTRQWLLVSRRSAYEPGTGEHRLWLSVGGSAGHSGLWAVDIYEGTQTDDFAGRQWHVTVASATEARRDAHETAAQKKRAEKAAARDGQDAADRRRIIDVLASGPRSASACGAAARMGRQRADYIIELLLADGRVEWTDIEVPAGKNRTRKVAGLQLRPVASSSVETRLDESPSCGASSPS
jgi:hypothetical protein